MIQGEAMARFRFGGGASETILNPATIVLMVIAIVLILTLPRNKAITPFALAFFTIPYGQVLVLGGLHFTVLQILILTVLARMAVSRASSSKGLFAGGFNSLDMAVVPWSVLELVAFVIQWGKMQAFIKGLGDLVIYLGGYLAARYLIPDRKTIRRTIETLAVICVIQGICMVSELFTYRNVFASMGANSPTIRASHVRAEGTMGGLYAGAFAGVLIPLFLWLWKEKSWIAGYAGFAGATAMVFASHASTSFLAFGGSLVGLCFWPLRKRMRLVRWGIVAGLVGLHLAMNGPVWSLIEHIDLTGGSSSYHRYMLVDNCIRHFSDWWLIGYKYYGDWGFDMWDVCNQFVVAALTGGLVALLAFITIYSRGFSAIGSASRQAIGNCEEEWSLWCLGSALFSNVVASFGVNYMNHLMMCFYLLLASISVATFAARKAPIRVEEEPKQNRFAFAPAATGLNSSLKA